MAVTVAVDLALLVGGTVVSIESFGTVGWGLLAWIACVAVLGLASIQTDAGPQLGMDMPVLLAAGFAYGPIVAGTIAFAGFADMRELRGAIPISRALFNRAQTSLSVMAAAGVFGALAGTADDFPLAVPGALLAVGVDGLVNYALVVGVMVLHERSSIRACLGRLRIGRFGDFSLTYLSFGLLSLLLAQVHLAIGSWGLVLFTLPIVLARKALSGTQQLEGAQLRIRTQGKAIRRTAERMADERRDERLAIAAGLHDDVLPPLFKVHLLGRVLSEDLASGRLLDLEEDVPELLRATDEASEATRTLIRTLRSSPLGSRGLAAMLRLMARQAEGASRFGPSIELDVEECDCSPVVQLLAYQVAREALRNALRHSNATVVRVTLHQEDEDLRLVVEDNGDGFDASLVDRDSHFGLSLMDERVELAGGLLHVDSHPGGGTRILVRLPRGWRDVTA